jgi:hypothetical protein
VRPVIIKGAALAHTIYADSHLRPSSDADLFIEFDQLGTLSDAFEELDYRRAHLVAGDLIMPQVSYTRTTVAGAPQICDVHWKLARPQAFAQAVTYGGLLGESVPIPALGRHALAAGDVDALVIACAHRVAHHSHEPRLIWLYDIHLLAERLGFEGLRRTAEVAGRRRLGAVCASGLSAAHDWFGTPLPAGLIDALNERSRESREESRELIESSTNLRVLISDLKLVTRWPDKLRLLQQHAFPSPAYMFRTYGIESRPMLPALYTRRLFVGAWRWVKESL